MIDGFGKQLFLRLNLVWFQCFEIPHHPRPRCWMNTYHKQYIAIRNGICYDHSRSEVWRFRSEDHIFINKFCFLEKLVDAHASSASAWRRP